MSKRNFFCLKARSWGWEHNMQSIVCDGCGSSVAGNQDNLPILKTVTYAGKSYDVFVRVNISGKNSDLCPSCSSAAAHVAGALL